MSSSTNFWSLKAPLSFPLDSDPTFSYGFQAADPFMSHPGLPGSIVQNFHPFFRFCQSRGNRTIPTNYASGQDTRAPVWLDTRKWSPSPSFTGPQMIPESHFLPIDVGSFIPYSYSDEIFTSDRAMGPGTQSMSQVIPGTQPVPDPSLSFWVPMGNGDATFGANLDYTDLLASNCLVQLPTTSSSTEQTTCSVSDERKSPLAIYRSPDRNGLGRRRSRRPRAVNVGGIWIDEDDLYSSAGKGMITVHECQWNKSSSPCGMWIVGSRTQVGAHIRKWHKRSNNDSRTSCLWDGCTKAMLKDSINRHVVTVHLGEEYHCQGCDQVFSRQDVYDKHVEDDEACRDAGAVMVYGTECREIDTSQTLLQEFVVQADNSM